MNQSIEDLCNSVLNSQKGISKMLELEIKKISIFIDKMTLNSFTTNKEEKFINDVNKLIDSLIMYEWISLKKIDSIQSLLNENYEK